MPIVNITFLEGRTEDQKRALVKEVTDAITKTINAKPESIMITLNEISTMHLATGGVLKADKKQS
jgi:4-oxalocrotonate tautomerase